MDGRRVDLRGAPFGLRPYRVRNLSKVRGCWERPVCRSVSVEYNIATNDFHPTERHTPHVILSGAASPCEGER